MVSFKSHMLQQYFASVTVSKKELKLEKGSNK